MSCGEKLRAGRATEFAADERNNNDSERSDKCGQGAKAANGVAEDLLRQPPDHRRQRRMVDVPPSRMLCVDHEVQFVAVEPVSASRRNEQCEQRG